MLNHSVSFRRIRVRLSGLAAAALLLCCAGAAGAAETCYTDAEFVAEQAIRLHSEMMVVGLKCHKIYKEREPFAAYMNFTTRNQEALARWEETLINHFRKRSFRRPTRAFDRLRTSLANELAAVANLTPPTYYCEDQMERLERLAVMTAGEFSAEVTKADAVQYGRLPRCRVPAARTQEASYPFPQEKPRQTSELPRAE